ncbi:MAG: POTRA domain-containing protein [Nitrospira sp.]|nr:MAG: POTRA domain-containing protein [Nitrospira sp.]
MRYVCILSRFISLRAWLFPLLSLVCALTVLTVSTTALAAQDVAESDPLTIDTASIDGLIHTKQETILRLLPRPLPADYTPAELAEFERRIRNLSLFDHVQVTRDGQALTVTVQEKVTLVPILNFTSGSSMKDLNATVGMVEYNLFGTGTQLGGQFNYSQRGPNVELWLSQHAFEPDRWAKEIKGFYNVNGIRFAESASTWTRNRIGSELELRGPYSYGSPLRYEIVAEFYREQIEDLKGGRPQPVGYYVGLIPELTWDKYHWHDLVPSGYRIALELRPGFLFGANQQRHEAKLRYLQGIPLGSHTVFMINSVAEAVNNSGNPNHSLLIGSIAGIRGLSDNLYRNRAQAYTNLEFRHAIAAASRWAVQGVLFTDFGAFQSFKEDGTLQSWQGAINVGTGIRVIPTFLSNTLLRIDVGHLFSPDQNTLVQIGITQYF